MKKTTFHSDMNWLNLSIQTLDSENFLGSDPTERATWLCLLRYCIGQENGGVITGCSGWADRKWQQLVRVTKDEVQSACDLWSWEGETLVVWGYPLEKEQEVQRNREIGSKGGKARTEAKIAAVKANGSKGGRPKTQAETKAEPKQNLSENQSENLTERKEKEIERKESPPTPQGGEHTHSANFYDDEMLTENAKAMLELEKRVQSLRSGWNLPLGHTEQRQLMASARCLSALTKTEWQILRDYLFAKIPQGVPAWQPRTRSKFLENPADVWAHASEWHRKQQSNRPPPNTIPMPTPNTPRAVISREELAEVFGQPELRKKI